MRTELPEERLLNLIKFKGRRAPDALHAAKPAERHMNLSSVKRLFDPKALKPRDLLHINRALAAAVAVSLVYLASTFLFPYKGKQDMAASIPVEEAAGQPSDGALKDHASYFRTIGSRNLFFSEAFSPAADVGQSSGLSERFNLVGIIAGDNPQAVIEDKKAGKTYYLYKGASFNGTIVEDIENGRVILDCKGERVSLVL